ncbi:hypothetical protein L7F22_019705 [Adiantum nelumboides]|nr:hypothetical protein [Adiantum nelumboides]
MPDPHMALFSGLKFGAIPVQGADVSATQSDESDIEIPMGNKSFSAHRQTQRNSKQETPAPVKINTKSSLSTVKTSPSVAVTPIMTRSSGLKSGVSPFASPTIGLPPTPTSATAFTIPASDDSNGHQQIYTDRQKLKQPKWNVPSVKSGYEEPSLQVFNSLTRTKVDFIPVHGKQITWYTCGPTVYDSSHLGHARIHIYLKQYKEEHSKKGLSKELLQEVQKAWSTFFGKTLKKLAPKAPPGEPEEPEDETAFEEISRRMVQDAAWTKETSETEPKTSMWFTALNKSRQAIIAATISVTAGQSLSDPAIFRETAAFWEGEFFKDMKRLHVQRPTTLTRVSEYVPEIVTFIEKIIGNGYAYEDSGPGDGKKNVWFDTRSFDGADRKGGSDKHSYAKLAPWSKGNKELLEEGEGSLSTGASTVAGKRAPSDFALWKSSKQESLLGILHGDQEDQDGTSNAALWLQKF